MFIVDDVNSLKEKLQLIKESHLTSHSISLETALMDVAYTARRLLENINELDFEQYEYTLETRIHAISVTEKTSGELVCKQNKYISLRHFCSKLVHVVKFDLRDDGQHLLDVTTNRDENFQVFYRDFITGLNSLVLSRRLVVLALCDLAARSPRKGNNQSDSPTPPVTFNWLVSDHLPEEDQLKLDVLKEIFKIEDVPANALPKLTFSNVTDDVDTVMTIDFGPHWETGQRVKSPKFPRGDMFEVVREFYKEPYDSRRVHNN